MDEVELAVIGAGPAGIAAATQAARLGMDVTLMDENLRPGGAIYRQLPESFVLKSVNQLGKDYIKGQKLIEDLLQYQSRIRFLEDAVVWGAFEDRSIEIVRHEKNQSLKCQKLILAEGAHERPMPFPGWTLPGVFAAGGVHSMLRTQQVLPGETFLLTGTGPLQLVVANQLLRSGARVVAVLEAASFRVSWKPIAKMWGQWELVKDGLCYLNELRKHRVPLLTSHAIVEARGKDQVTGVTYAKVDKDWKPIHGTERDVEVDAICVGYGFVPSTRLSRLCGCKLMYRHDLGGWIPEHNHRMETSVPGVYVAGDGAGVSGALAAVEEGRLCSIWASHGLGRISDREADRLSGPILKKLSSIRKFRTSLDEVSAFRPGWLARMRRDTTVCRCEEVTYGEILKVIAEGAVTLSELKMFTRAGMGYCQGRMCESSLAALLSMHTGKSIEDIGPFTPRPPLKPIRLGDALAQEQTD